jgi:hypothetical protein
MRIGSGSGSGSGRGTPSGSRRRRGASAAISGLLLSIAVGARAQTAVTCTETAGPVGSETTATISILSPVQGAVLTDCSDTVQISGTWSTSR